MSEKTAMTVVLTVAIIVLVIAVLLWWSTAYI